MIEVELKFEVPAGSRPLLQTKIDALCASPLEQIENVDTYYDTACFACLQQAVFIRIRNHMYLELKYHEHADPAHMHSTERAFPLELAPTQMQEVNLLCSRFIPTWRQAGTIEEAIHTNGLAQFVHIENRRTRYVYGDLVLCIDSVEGLGDFFEVETHCKEAAKIEAAIARLQGFIASLALPSLRRVKVGYVELWLRLHLPQVYQLGTFQEPS